jgi:hypothetical protein
MPISLSSVVPKGQFAYDRVKDSTTGKCFSGYLPPTHVQWKRKCADENKVSLKGEKISQTVKHNEAKIPRI